MLTKLQIDKVRYAYSLIDEINTLYHTPYYKDDKVHTFHAEYSLRYIYLYLKEGLVGSNLDVVYEVSDLVEKVEATILDSNSLLYHSAVLIKMLSEYALLVITDKDEVCQSLANEIFEYFKTNIAKV